MQSFLPIGEQEMKKENNKAHTVIKDGEHRLAQISLAGFQLEGELQVSSYARLIKLPMQHPFMQQLIDTYKRCYELHVLNFGRKPLKWYRRIAYTDS